MLARPYLGSFGGSSLSWLSRMIVLILILDPSFKKRNRVTIGVAIYYIGRTNALDPGLIQLTLGSIEFNGTHL